EQMRQHAARRLTGAEPFDVRLAREVRVGLIDLGLHGIGGDLDLELHKNGRNALHCDLHGEREHTGTSNTVKNQRSKRGTTKEEPRRHQDKKDRKSWVVGSAAPPPNPLNSSGLRPLVSSWFLSLAKKAPPVEA